MLFCSIAKINDICLHYAGSHEREVPFQIFEIKHGSLDSACQDESDALLPTHSQHHCHDLCTEL